MHNDHLGSSASATNVAGNLLWRESYTPFGETLYNPAANANNQGYTGHIQDTASGLTYMQARNYDPVIGRFHSSDPVGFASGGPGFFNRYAYAFNNPTNLVDPSGLAPIEGEPGNKQGNNPTCLEYNNCDSITLSGSGGGSPADCCQPAPNPNKFTLERAGNGRGAGPNGGVVLGGRRGGDIRYTHEEFADFAERSAGFTVGVGTGAQGGPFMAHPGLANLSIGMGLSFGGSDLVIDSFHGAPTVESLVRAFAFGSLTGFSGGGIPAGSGAVGYLSRGMMVAPVGAMGVAFENGSETTGTDLLEGAIGAVRAETLSPMTEELTARAMEP